jgi:hypothetical protein
MAVMVKQRVDVETMRNAEHDQEVSVEIEEQVEVEEIMAMAIGSPQGSGGDSSNTGDEDDHDTGDEDDHDTGDFF